MQNFFKQLIVGSMSKSQAAQRAIREYLAEIGAKGGKAKVPKGLSMVPEARRKEIARKAVKARWAKAKGKKDAAR